MIISEDEKKRQNSKAILDVNEKKQKTSRREFPQPEKQLQKIYNFIYNSKIQNVPSKY